MRHRLVDEASLDSGVEGFRFEGDRFVRETVGAGDGRLTPELYRAAIPAAERDVRVWNFLRRGREIPWSHFDLDPGTLDDEALRGWVGSTISRIDGGLLREGYRVRNFEYTLEKARRLFAAMIAPAADGGLGLRFDDVEEGPARNPIGVYRDRTANCVEFTVLFLMAADMAGIPVVPMELFQNGSGDLQEHIRIGIRDPESGGIQAVVDLENNYFGPPPSGEISLSLNRLELLAYYYNMKGTREADRRWVEADVNLRRAEADTNFAYRLNPRNYLILYNRAYYAATNGRLREARRCLLESIVNYPRYPRSYWNLHVIARDLGETRLSGWALQRYRDLSP